MKEISSSPLKYIQERRLELMYTKSDNTFILRWAKKIRAVEYLGGKCIKCSKDDIFCLDFHHAEEKEKMISRLLGGRWSSLCKELDKCQLLCRNCHAELHSSVNGRNYDLKKEIFGDDIKCSKCSYIGDNLASLDFHHLRDKGFEIWKVYNRTIKVNAEELQEELRKGILLCRNCHAINTTDFERYDRFEQEILRRSKEYRELRPEIDPEKIWHMYASERMRQKDIAAHFKCSKGTISSSIKRYKIKKER
jgi:hypothetical protein